MHHDYWLCLDLYRFDAAPVSRLSGLCFEGQWAFPAQS